MRGSKLWVKPRAQDGVTEFLPRTSTPEPRARSRFRTHATPLRLLIVIALLGIGSVSPAAEDEPPTLPKAPYVLPETVRTWQAQGDVVTLIDVRQLSEFQAGHIEGAINIPYDTLEARVAEVPHNHSVVTYCIFSSWRAPYAANLSLVDVGYNNVSVLAGGIADWNAGGQVVYATRSDQPPPVETYSKDLPTLKKTLSTLKHTSDRTYQEPLVLTKEELRFYDGKGGRPAYVAVRGVIYDVTQSRLWRGGEHDPSHGMAQAGFDLTDLLNNSSPHGEEPLKRFPIVGHLITLD